MITKEKTEILSVSEFKEAMSLLSNADFIKLGGMADALCWGLAVEGKELLSLAFCRALEGKRKCPKSLSIIVFIYGVMESLKSAYFKKRKNDPLSNLVDFEGEDTLDINDLQTTMDTPEELLLAKQTLKDIDSIFASNDTEQMVLLGKIDECSPSEIQEMLGISSVQYASALKGIKRKLEKLGNRS